MVGLGCNFFKNKKGITLIEALVSTVIIGIGFVAIFQMAKYSVESMSISSDRTKANYLVSMVAEDLVGNRHAKVGNDGFVDYLRKSNHAFQVKGCKKAYTRKSDMNEELRTKLETNFKQILKTNV